MLKAKFCPQISMKDKIRLIRRKIIFILVFLSDSLQSKSINKKCDFLEYNLIIISAPTFQNYSNQHQHIMICFDWQHLQHQPLKQLLKIVISLASPFFHIIKSSGTMESLKKENAEIQKSIQVYLEEIERQKELNSQHESEIQTLLKFNERLLGIIENQLNNKKDTCSLQPISERSERESDLMGPTINSLMKSKRLVAKSERGPATRNSLVERAHHKINLFEKQGQKSQINHSFDNDELSDFKLQKSDANKAVEVEKKIIESNEVKKEMNKQINELKKFKNESTKFYDSKINEIRNLSNKLGTYKPIEQFSQISQKLNLSAGAAEMIKKVIMKSSQ